MMAVEGSTISVFLLAENRLLRESLCRILNKRSGLEVVGAAGYVPDIEETIVAADPRVLVFDPHDGAFGLELLRTLRESLPALRVVLIGMEPRTDLFIQAIRQGVAGYVLSDATAAQVTAAVRAVADCQAVCPPELCRALFDHIAADRNRPSISALNPKLGLTRREQQLVQMISRGATNKQIADDLCISEQTVKNHVHRMMRKVGVTNRAAAAEACRAEMF